MSDKSNEKKEKIFQALNEAVDALGDIPADIVTEQQKKAYKLCREQLGNFDCSDEYS